MKKLKAVLEAHMSFEDLLNEIKSAGIFADKMLKVMHSGKTPAEKDMRIIHDELDTLTQKAKNFI